MVQNWTVKNESNWLHLVDLKHSGTLAEESGQKNNCTTS